MVDQSSHFRFRFFDEQKAMIGQDFHSVHTSNKRIFFFFSLLLNVIIIIIAFIVVIVIIVDAQNKIDFITNINQQSQDTSYDNHSLQLLMKNTEIRFSLKNWLILSDTFDCFHYKIDLHSFQHFKCDITCDRTISIIGHGLRPFLFSSASTSTATHRITLTHTHIRTDTLRQAHLHGHWVTQTSKSE